MNSWHNPDDEQFNGELRIELVQFKNMTVLLLVTLKGRLLLSWTPSNGRSVVMQVLGTKFAGSITSR